METVLEPCITSNLSATGGGGGNNSSSVERCVIHDLPEHKQRRYDAVENAIIHTKENYGKQEATMRLQIIELVYFQKTHTLTGAGDVVNCHANTCGKYSADFIKLVAENLDLA